MKSTKRPIKLFFGLVGLFVALSLAIFVLLTALAKNYHPERYKINNPAKTWTLSNVNIVVPQGETTLIENVDVSIVDGVIANIDRTGLNKIDGLKIDGAGAFVTPGLIDAHAHIEDSAYLGLALSHGVTTIRGMRGNKAQLNWRDQIDADVWLGSRFIVASPILDGDAGDPFHVNVTTSDQAAQLVSQYANTGYDLVKIYANMPSELLKSIMAQAKRSALPVAKHGAYTSYNDLVLSTEFNSTMQSVEHIEDVFSVLMERQFSQEQLSFVIKQLKRMNLPLVTTLAVYEELTELSLDKEKYLEVQPLHYMNMAHKQLTHQFGVERWLNASAAEGKYNHWAMNTLLKITKELYENDIPLVVGSDSGALIGQAGFATHRELKLLQKAGLSNQSIIAAATIIPAKMLGLEQLTGEVKVGLNADFIVTKVNPLEDLNALTSPYAIAKGGVYLDENSILKLRNNAKQTQSSWLTYPMLLFAPINQLIGLSPDIIQ